MSTARIEINALPKEIIRDEFYPRTPLSTLGFLAQTSKQFEKETSLLRLLAASINAVPRPLCDLSLISKYNEKSINQSTLDKAKQKLTPILIQKENEYLVYGDAKGDGNFVFTKITASASFCNNLSFEKGMIEHTDKAFTSSLINVLKQGHAPFDVTALLAMDMLKKRPGLLFEKKMRVKDHYGREIFASPYQIFLGAGDVWALKQIHQDILPLIKGIDANAEAEVQFREQFPNCPWPIPEKLSEEMLYDDRNKRQIDEIKAQLAAVKECIDVDPFDNHKPNKKTKLVVDTLCKLFQPTPGETLCSGLHFPLGIIKEIFKTNNELKEHWSFFSLAVIKPALDALSTVDGQCCQYGISKLNEENGPNRRCHSSYQHPLGKPLTLTLNKRRAVVVSVCDGDVLVNSDSCDFGFDLFTKNASLYGMKGGCSYGFHCKEELEKFMAKTYKLIKLTLEEKSVHCQNIIARKNV